jgi:hypothetical protein
MLMQSGELETARVFLQRALLLNPGDQAAKALLDSLEARRESEDR